MAPATHARVLFGEYTGHQVWQDGDVWREDGTSGIHASKHDALYWAERHAVDHIFESHIPGVASAPANHRRGHPYAVLGGPIRITTDRVPIPGLASIRRRLAAIGWRIVGMSAIESMDNDPAGGVRTVISRHGVRYIVQKVGGAGN